MHFPIFIRNSQTGEERNFLTKEAVAEFLQTAEHDLWEGWQALGIELKKAEASIESAVAEMVNGLTEDETSGTASVSGLSSEATQAE
jgi:hypothetical protein